MAEERRWTLDLILSVLGYCTTHNRFATLTPDEVIAECVQLFTDFDGPGSPCFQETDECDHRDDNGITYGVEALAAFRGQIVGHRYNFCPDCGTRLQGGENVTELG